MKNHKEMSFLEHLGELRGHLIRASIAIGVMGIIIGYNIEWVVNHILFYPINPDFPTFKIINHFTQKYFGEVSFLIPEKFPIQVRKLYEQFNATISLSLFGGILCSFPYIVWELWSFVSPALLSNERKYSLIIINSTWMLFFLGVFCGYFIILPFAINFGYFYRISDQIILSYDLSDYLSIFLKTVFGMGLIFLLPILVYILTKFQILTPYFMSKYRRHSYVLILTVSAIITPADVISMFVAAIPLIFLYEISLLLSGWVRKD